MSSFTSIDDVYKWLDQIPMFGKTGASAANFSLQSIRRFCAELGDPQNSYPTIHVAGTNGKGTTCQMLASVYQSAGYKTGLYTSPHLIDYRERFRVNAAQISEQDLLRFFRRFDELLTRYSLTYFEISTAIAFWFFEQQKVDIAIIETGLGGLLDATNIITPEVSVITSVGLDHTDILGDSLGKIAKEKGGIIKPKKPVVVGRLKDEAMYVVKEIAAEKKSDLYNADSLIPKFKSGKITLQLEGKELKIDAAGRSKIDAVNCSMAYQTVQQLKNRFAVSDENFVHGIEQLPVRFPYHGHFERLHPELNWFFDGGHNHESVSALVEQLHEIAPMQEWTLVLSMMRDKMSPDVLNQLQNFKSVYLYPQEQERAATFDELKSSFPSGVHLKADNSLPENWIEKHKTELVIFGGSFYFYNVVRRWMGAIATN